MMMSKACSANDISISKIINYRFIFFLNQQSICTCSAVEALWFVKSLTKGGGGDCGSVIDQVI